MMKEELFSKTPAQFKTKVENHTLFVAKIRTLFLTKIAEKQYCFGRTYLHSPYKGVPPPVGRGQNDKLTRYTTRMQTTGMQATV